MFACMCMSVCISSARRTICAHFARMKLLFIIHNTSIWFVRLIQMFYLRSERMPTNTDAFSPRYRNVNDKEYKIKYDKHTSVLYSHSIVCDGGRQRDTKDTIPFNDLLHFVRLKWCSVNIYQCIRQQDHIVASVAYASIRQFLHFRSSA